MLQPGRAAITAARRPWYEAVRLPGAGQVQHAQALLLSRPFLSRIPDQSLITSDPGRGVHHVRATRDQDGRYALVYVPTGQPVEIDLEKLAGTTLTAWWYDPRLGIAQRLGEFPRRGTRAFTPPADGPDWVLVLDDAAEDFPAPGRLNT
jgi:hypothetical protein